ncbi:dihydrofolate reductase family protein [Nocardia sp. MW-W600-9]
MNDRQDGRNGRKDRRHGALPDPVPLDAFLLGSGALAQTLLAAGLVDTMNLPTFPVVLGTGKKLFTETVRPTGFALTDVRTTSTGVLIASYRADGAPKYGDFSAG